MPFVEALSREILLICEQRDAQASSFFGDCYRPLQEMRPNAPAASLMANNHIFK